MENRAFILHFGKIDNKKNRNLCLFTTAVAIDDRQPVDEQIVDKKEQKPHRRRRPQQPRCALGKLLHDSGELEDKNDERVHDAHTHGAEAELRKEPQRFGRDRVKIRLHEGIIAEKAEHKRCFLVRAEKKSQDCRRGKAAPCVAFAAFLARGQKRSRCEDRPGVGRERNDAAEPEEGDRERAQYAAQRQFMCFLCQNLLHIAFTDIPAPSRRGARW